MYGVSGKKALIEKVKDLIPDEPSEWVFRTKVHKSKVCKLCGEIYELNLGNDNDKQNFNTASNSGLVHKLDQS